MFTECYAACVSVKFNNYLKSRDLNDAGIRVHRARI